MNASLITLSLLLGASLAIAQTTTVPTLMSYQGRVTDTAGVLIGNGCVNNTVQNSDTFVAFQHENNLIPASSNPKSATAGRAAMSAYLGYQPNYYDYRLTSISCAACYSYNYTAWSYWLLQSDILTALNVCGQAGFLL
jgi:hypothetical protein